MTINNLPPAVMWGDYWMMSKFESADGRHRLHDRARIRTPRDFFSSKSIGAKGGAGQNTTQYDSPEVDKLLAGGRGDRRPGQAQGDLPEDAGDHPPGPALPADLPVRDGRRAPRPGLQGFTPNVNVQENCWNAAVVLGELIGRLTRSGRTQARSDCAAKGGRAWHATCSAGSVRA